MNNWIEVSEDALTTNFRVLRSAAGDDTMLLAVIKANAYGHGAEHCAPMLVRAGACWLGVTNADEGARVRQALTGAGLRGEAQPDILVMSGFLPADVPSILEHRLTPVIWTEEHIAWLEGEPLPVHLEIDTGMSRQGVLPGKALQGLLQLLATSRLRLDGVFTHFASAEIAHGVMTLLQERRFAEAVERIAASGLRPAWIHAANSSAIDNPPTPADWLRELAASLGARLMARPGLALYGYTLPIEGDAVSLAGPALLPVMTWKAAVLSVRDLQAGDLIGYGSTFTADRPMRVALLPVGYADGLRRELSSTGQKPGGWVILDNKAAAILGRVSMNLTVVDVTEIPGVKPGDEAVILGDGVTADDHARIAGTIAYEILCGIHPC